ncbi:tpr domain protein [Diaporthe amygdali]|uniref:tpr domain protein n=1 Tax=Phomopsis amygdali TaxID=1214568 RepID=UPI0022FF1C8E|nr:tpr domain protein [Diaporthe amygdali]KAJ0119782.1 tpr domain protein [Diaporthe amygdali]
MGDGLFAVKDMPAGTRVLSDKPLIIVPTAPMQATLAQDFDAFITAARDLDPNLNLPVQLLSDQVRSTTHPQTMEVVQNWFLSRFSLQETSPSGDFIRKCAEAFTTYRKMATRLPQQYGKGVFFTYCKINHSCSPNAFSYYDHTRNLMRVHLVRDVKAGDQIFISYIDSEVLTRAERHARLNLKGHNFVCNCTLCTNQEVEAIVQRISVLYHSLSNFLVDEGVQAGQINPAFNTPDDIMEAMATAEELVALFRHPLVDLQGIDLKWTLNVCSCMVWRLGDVDRAAMYAREEVALQVRLWGFETEHFGQKGNAMKWLRRVEEERARGW